MGTSPESLHPAEPFPFLSKMDIPVPWEEAAGRFLEGGGVAMILGGVDTGKSTLARYLVYRAYRAGMPVALVDLDLGQSHLGPPATLGLGFFPPSFPGEDYLFPQGLVFIGQTSPLGQLLEVAVGCRTLVDQALHQGLTRVVVNTCGLIHGPAALRLKKAKLELLRPGLVLALERDGEIQPFLHALGVSPTVLPVSTRAVSKTMEIRRRYREDRFRRYFRQARRLTLPLRSLTWQGLPWGAGRPLGQEELRNYGDRLGQPPLYGEAAWDRLILFSREIPPDIPAPLPREKVQWFSLDLLKFQLLGLLDGAHHTLALALLLPSDWERQEIALWTPLPQEQAGQVRFLKVGHLKVSLEGRELNREP